MPRTRTPTVVSIILAFGALSIGVRQVQSPPVQLSDEKLKPRSVGCAPYTRWDPSGETCVSCSPEDCLPGEELREDCGYNEEGYPVANSCRPCPNGTYSSNGGQKHCQACKTCLSGYKQECSSKQPAVCLCADDEELAPGGTTCQKICCRCLPDPNPSDVIGECVYRHPTTPQYRCKKYSWSAGETCRQLPQPTTPTVHVSTAAPTSKTNGTTSKTDAPTPGSTPPATPDQPPTTHPSGEASTSEGMSTVTPGPVPGPVAKGQPIFAVVLEVLAAFVVIIFILCCLKYWKTHKAETEGGDLESSDLLQESDDEAQGENFKEDADATDEEDGGGSIIIDGDSRIKEVDKPSDGDSGTVSNESSETSSDKKSPFSSEDSLLLTSSSTSITSTDEQGDDRQETGGTEETGETADSNDETMPKGDDRQETGGTEETGETADSDDETVSKEPGQEDTMEFKETIEEFPNDEKGQNTAPPGMSPGGGANQQQPQGGGGQPPPYTGHHGQNGAPAQGPQQVPVVNITGGHFYGNFIIQGNNSQYFEASTAGQQQPPNNGRGNPAPRQGDGRRQHPAQQGIGGGDGAGPNNGAAQWNQGGNGNGRVGNRRRQDIQVNILPNRATPGQDVRFSCFLPPDIDPSTCEFRWRKEDQVHCVAQVQHWNRAVQHCDVGVYTCEVTTPGGEVLDGQAELVIIEDDEEDSRLQVDKPSDGDSCSGTVPKESSDTSSGIREPGPEDTMEFVETIEGYPNDEKGQNAVPPGGGANRPHQQQPQGGRGQPPPYPGQNGAPAQGPQQLFNNYYGPVNNYYGPVNMNNFYGPVNYNAEGQQQPPNNGRGNPAPRQGDGRRQHPAQQGIGGGDGAGPNNGAAQGNQGGDGNSRVGNRRRQNIRVNILPNRARLGQDVRFSCVLPPDIDPSTCEFRWRKRDQVDCVARGQNWNRAVQHCDAGVYTCEVTTPGGEVLDGQAELVIIEDNAAGGVALPGPSRRPRDDEHTPRKKPRTAGPGTSGAQGFSASMGQIQGMDGQGAQNRGRSDRNPADGTAPRQADGRRQHPPPQHIDRQGGSDRAGPYYAAVNQLQGAAAIAQNDRLAHPPGNGNGRVGNRRRQVVHRHAIPATPVDDIELNEMKDELDNISNKSDSDDSALPEERLEDTDQEDSDENDQEECDRLREVPHWSMDLPLTSILNEEDLLDKLKVLLEQEGRTHYKNIGSHLFKLSHDQLLHIEYHRVSTSPTVAVLKEGVTRFPSMKIRCLLYYVTGESLRRKDVANCIVKHFTEADRDAVMAKLKQ